MAVSSQGIRGDVDKAQAFWGIRMIGEDNLKHLHRVDPLEGVRSPASSTRHSMRLLRAQR